MNVPNLITLGRLLLVPVVIWFILSDRMLGAFILFLLAGISDAVDGFIAKRFNAETWLGQYLDPLADKALLISIFVTLGLESELPSWLVILVVTRDLLILGGALFSYVLNLTVMVMPSRLSKLNTLLQIVLAASVLARLGLGLDLAEVVIGLIIAVALTTVLSGADYLIEWTRTASAGDLPPAEQPRERSAGSERGERRANVKERRPS